MLSSKKKFLRDENFSREALYTVFNALLKSLLQIFIKKNIQKSHNHFHIKEFLPFSKGLESQQAFATEEHQRLFILQNWSSTETNGKADVPLPLKLMLALQLILKAKF